MRLDVSVARQVEDVNVGKEAVIGGVKGARPASSSSHVSFSYVNLIATKAKLHLGRFRIFAPKP